MLVSTLERNIEESITEMSHSVCSLSSRVERLQREITILASMDRETELLQTPVFQETSREQWRAFLSEFSALHSHLRGVTVEVQRWKENAVKEEVIGSLSAEVASIAQTIAHHPSRPKNLGSMVERLKAAYTEADDDDAEIPADEPSYVVVGGSWGLTVGTLPDAVGLASFVDLERVGLATVGDLRNRGITSPADLATYVAGYRAAVAAAQMAAGGGSDDDADDVDGGGSDSYETT